MNLAPRAKIWDVGEGDLYMGRPYRIPYFFENSQWKMMKEPDDPLCISFRSWKGNFYQFFIDTFHNKPALVITSTLRDCYFLPNTVLSMQGSADRYLRYCNKKTPVKDSFSGFYSWGKKLLKQRETLMSHLKDDNMYFSDDVLAEIYAELKRRAEYE